MKTTAGTRKHGQRNGGAKKFQLQEHLARLAEKQRRRTERAQLLKYVDCRGLVVQPSKPPTPEELAQFITKLPAKRGGAK